VFGATQSVVLRQGTSATVALPRSDQGTLRVEMRVHDRTPVHRPNLGDIVRVGPVAIANFNGNDTTLVCTSDARFIAYIYNLPQDFMVRVQRDADRRLMTCEVWDTLTGKSVGAQTVAITPAAASTGPLTIGSRFNDSRLAFLRVFSTVLPLKSAAPLALRGPGDIVNFEFDGDSRDLSSSGLNLRFSGEEAYDTTPVHAPVCIAGESSVFTTTEPMTLDAGRSYALDDSELTYEWSALRSPGTATLQWLTGVTDRVTSLTGGVFGTYEFQLKVTDGSGQSSTCTTKHGAVAVDDHGVVKLPDETDADRKRNALLGPLIAFGRNPWPWADDRHKGMADYFGAKLQNEWLDYWNVPLQGSISVTKGSATVVGSGTNFREEFCGGGNVPTPYHYLIIWYPLSDDKYGRVYLSVKACNSDEELTLAAPYTRSASASGLNYTNDRFRHAPWTGNATNANFYDNVLAYYSLYYRTGLDTYLEYARTLADRWWTMPSVDEGRTCADTGVCLWPRNQALTGLTIRALERDDMWQGMRRLWDYYRPWVRTRTPINDIRERGYELMFVAQCALVDPDPAHREACAVDVNEAISHRWAPQQRRDKSWASSAYYAGHSSWSDGFAPGGGTVSVENGSTRVIGHGTKWEESWFKNLFFWVCDDASNGDPVTYFNPKFISPTELELPRPYEGPTATGKKWQSAEFVGVGTLPYMMGIVATAMNYAHKATGNDLARQLAIDATYWIKDVGFQPTTKGLYYARGFTSCEPISDDVPHCAYPLSYSSSARFLNAEVFNALTQTYIYTRDETLRQVGDEMYGAVFGNPAFGGPSADAYYVSMISDSGYSITASKAKDFGFMFGMGFGAAWPAARLANVSEAVQRFAKVNGDAASHTGMRARTVSEPRGRATGK
jgi:hypothetical protein